MEQIKGIRAQVARFMVVYLWLHVPLAAIAGAMVSGEWVMTTIGALVLAGATTLTWRMAAEGEATLYTVGVALMGMVALLVFAFEGHPWQIDMHMYFFAALAMLTAFCDWRTLVVAAGAVAVHHLVLNFAYPAAVFPGGGSFLRVVLHAVIVVAQTAVLGWVAWRLIQAFTAAEKAAAESSAAHEAAAAAAASRDRMTQEAAAGHKAEMNDLAGSLQGEVGRVVEAMSQAATGARAAAEKLDGMVEDVSGKA
ncbi:MAG TPA: chemotaxis protein, partial [Candidatus Omnitrophota bacterium]|nr:chemotaxis protein [Candidatus Omnitrophota bacterium]